MGPKLRLQTPPFHIGSQTLLSRPHTPALTRPRHRDATSELQQRLNAVVKRVTGVSAPSSTSSSSPSTPHTPSSDDDDYASDYGGEEEVEEAEATQPGHREPFGSPSSLSSATSYTSLASLNPYVVDAEDLARHLSLQSPWAAEADTGDRHERDSARLARQLDRAHAAVEAEETAALRALRQQARLR